jgi:hypothetical protein
MAKATEAELRAAVRDSVAILETAETQYNGAFTLKEAGSRSYEVLLVTGRGKNKQPIDLISAAYAKVIKALAELRNTLEGAGVEIGRKKATRALTLPPLTPTVEPMELVAYKPHGLHCGRERWSPWSWLPTSPRCAPSRRRLALHHRRL